MRTTTRLVNKWKFTEFVYIVVFSTCRKQLLLTTEKQPTELLQTILGIMTMTM